MLNSKILIVSGATIWVIFQNSVTYRDRHDFFAITLIEHTPKSHLKKLKITLKYLFAMIIGPQVSIKYKGSNMCILVNKTKICYFVHTDL